MGSVDCRYSRQYSKKAGEIEEFFMEKKMVDWIKNSCIFRCQSRVRLAWICLLAVLLCCGCSDYGISGNGKEPAGRIDTAMGTVISQTLYGEGKEEALVGVLQEITLLEQDVLSWRLDTSQVYKINANAEKEQESMLSPELEQILQQCLLVSEASHGAFDITIGEVVRLWDIDAWAGREDAENYPIPSQEQLQKALEHSGYEKVKLQDNILTMPQNLQLDLGAVGKGIALDQVRAYLQEREGISGGVISVGGSILTYGKKQSGEAWRVAIVNPRDTSAYLGYLVLNGGWCVSTSGDYERYVEVDGIRYHHIIDPATGYPAQSGVKSVTVLSESGLLSDALSTACLILGEDAGMDLAEQFEVEALFVDEAGEITMTDGMKAYFHLSK